MDLQITTRAFCVLLIVGASTCGSAPRIEPSTTTAAPAAALNRSPSAATGLASWYGPGFDGKTTASGERFNSNHFTAAHATLPFGSIVRVTNLENGRTVDVRINDRGPFKKGRTIDLSKAAAREIGLIEAGVGRVELRVLSRPAS